MSPKLFRPSFWGHIKGPMIDVSHVLHLEVKTKFLWSWSTFVSDISSSSSSLCINAAFAHKRKRKKKNREFLISRERLSSGRTSDSFFVPSNTQQQRRRQHWTSRKLSMLASPFSKRSDFVPNSGNMYISSLWQISMQDWIVLRFSDWLSYTHDSQRI